MQVYQYEVQKRNTTSIFNWNDTEVTLVLENSIFYRIMWTISVTLKYAYDCGQNM